MTSQMQMPTAYPDGGPLRWQDEQSGDLPAAVSAYFNCLIDYEKVPTESQITLLTWYCRYYINAPCWSPGPYLRKLRHQAAEIKSLRDIVKFCEEAAEWGLDPF